MIRNLYTLLLVVFLAELQASVGICITTLELVSNMEKDYIIYGLREEQWHYEISVL